MQVVKVSLPTQKQVIDIAEYAIVGFVSTFVGVWIKQPNPFSRAAAIVAFGTAGAAILALAKGFLTTL